MKCDLCNSVRAVFVGVLFTEPVAREPNHKTQLRVLKCCKKMDQSTRRLVAAEKVQELLNLHENMKSSKKLTSSENSDIDGNATQYPIFFCLRFTSFLKDV